MARKLNHRWSHGGAVIVLAAVALVTAVPGDVYATNVEYADGVENRSPLIAAMTGEVICGFQSLTVAFADASAGEVSAWAWDFDSDGTVDSVEQNPVHLFDAPGSHTVTLTVGGPEGTDTSVRVGFVDGIAGLFKRMGGPAVQPIASAWELVDFDDDFDVELLDFALYQNVFLRCP